MPGRITIELTDQEAKVLGELSEDVDLPQDRVMIQALRMYQASRNPPEVRKVCTETMDKLFLELSHFTTAETARERALKSRVQALSDAVRGLLTCSLPQDVSGERIVEASRMALEQCGMPVRRA
jgi:hypothetical protein